eukprot:6124984-Amphidinium_carterae.1
MEKTPLGVFSCNVGSGRPKSSISPYASLLEPSEFRSSCLTSDVTCLSKRSVQALKADCADWLPQPKFCQCPI